MVVLTLSRRPMIDGTTVFDFLFSGECREVHSKSIRLGEIRAEGTLTAFEAAFRTLLHAEAKSSVWDIVAEDDYAGITLVYRGGTSASVFKEAAAFLSNKAIAAVLKTMVFDATRKEAFPDFTVLVKG